MIINTPSAVARASVRREFAATALGGQTAPQRVGYRSAVVAAGAEATNGSGPPEDAGMGRARGPREVFFAQLATNDKLRV